MLIARRLAHALALVLTLIVGAAAAAIIISQTAWFKNQLRAYIVREANQYLNGQISIQRLGGNLFFGIEMENVGVSLNGSEIVAVKDLGLDYNVFEFISKGMSVDELRLNQPVLYLRREGDTWSIARLIKREEQEADRRGPSSPITVNTIGISDASVVIDGPVGTAGVVLPERIDRLDARMSFRYEPVHYSIEIAHASFRGSDPAIGLNALSGVVAVKDDTVYMDKLAIRTEESSISIDGAVRQYLTTPRFNLRISSDTFSLPEFARVIPALAGVPLQPAFEVSAEGPLEQLRVQMNVRSSAGQVTGTLVADASAPGHSVKGELSVRHLDLAPILKDRRERTDLTGDARVDLVAGDFRDVGSVSGTVSVNAPRIVARGYAAEAVRADARIRGRRIDVNGRAAAYGANATATGRVSLASRTAPLSYDLRGRARQVDLRRLPRSLAFPRAGSNMNVEYRLAGTEPAAGSRLSRIVEGEARFEPSIVAGARIEQGSVVTFSVNGRQVDYSADAVVGDLDLQRIGEAFDLRALKTDRYKSALNAHVTARGSGTTAETMDLTTSGTLTDSSVLGGRVPHLAFTAALAGDTAQVKAAGAFADVNPAALSGRPAMDGSVAGTLNIDATFAGVSRGVTLDSVAATGRVALEPSTVGGLRIDRASLDGDYRDRSGEIRQLEVVGRDVNLKATGTLSLNESGQSNLAFQGDTPSLEEIGKLIDRPLAGIARVDGVITGNRTELTATGTILGNAVKYGEQGALALSTTYTARVPDLAFERAGIVADTHATFVTVAGQHINELAAKTTYAGTEITFEATAKQPQRTLAGTGSLALHADHREVHLQRLTLDAQGQQWQLAPGSEPTVRYGNDAVTVDQATLVNGDQRIAAAGTFGRSGDALRLTLENVDLAAADALMLRPPQLSGRVNASGVVSGTRTAPRFEGEFAVAGGGFRQFRYDTFRGSVDYTVGGLTLDTRLQQNATQWVTAKGYLPMALLARTGRRDASGPASDADRVDLIVDSSPIDLGIVQGFTTALADVGGTVEAHVRVTGTADDPRPEGAVTVQDGRMTVLPTGVTYTNIAGKIDLLPDRLHIDQLTVLDNQYSALTLVGDLAIDERRVKGVELYVTADDFKIVDNEFGNVRIESRMVVGGEALTPRLDGYLGVTTGVIDLDEILAMTGASAYATTPAEFAPAADPGQAPAPSGFDALKVDVHLIVPDDLVVRARSLQTQGSPIGLGALTVTLGGDLRVMKDPGSRIRLVGAVNTVRGTYEFQGRRFEILRDGTLRFAGLDELDPILDLRTRRLIQGVETRVNVRGTLKKPELVLSSTPPLEPADILSLIVFGQPINQLGEGQQISLAQRAQALATGAATSQLAQSIGRALNVDTFEIDLAPETGGGPELTVGQQVGQHLYVKVQQRVGDHSTTNLILEYELTDWLRLQTNVLQGSSTQQSLFRRAQGSGADLIFFFSY